MTTDEKGATPNDLALPHGALKGLADRLGVNYNTLRREVATARGQAHADTLLASAGVEYAAPDSAARLAAGPCEFRFGAIGDTHLGSKYERLDVLNALYDTFSAEGVATVYHTGNYLDGEKSYNRNDIHTFGLDGQVDYFVDTYPQRPGLVTRYIAGDDHEGWFVQQGIDVGRYTHLKAVAAGRTDLDYLGYMEVDVLVGGVLVRVLHPGGGTGKSISLTSQKVATDLADEPGPRPQVVLMGHYHKAHYLPDYMGVHVFQTGCTVEQSPWMRKKGLAADLGGWIVTLKVVDGRLARVVGEYIGFRNKRWSHVQRWKPEADRLAGL